MINYSLLIIIIILFIYEIGKLHLKLKESIIKVSKETKHHDFSYKKLNTIINLQI